MPVNANPIRAIGKNRFVIAGSFLPNGSSALAAAGILGSGFTVAYTSTGLYTVTLSETWLRLLSAKLTIGMNAATAIFPQLGVTAVSTTKTVQLRAIDGTGTLTDIASNANNRYHFSFIMSQDTVQT